MLRITRHLLPGTAESAGRRDLLVLEGALSGPWVSELEFAATPAAAAGRVCLDLSRVHFVDDAGLQLLQRLLAEGVAVQSLSPFVHELLQSRS
jgi:ABC-type transporter Mla MlaB component